MVNLNWESNRENVVFILSNYFGLGSQEILKAIDGNFPSFYDKQKLVSMVLALAPYCNMTGPAYEGATAKGNIDDRMKSGEAILSNPNFSDEESPSDIYYRLNRLYKSISSKGIDIYKTIYSTSLTDGNLGVAYDPQTGNISRYSNIDRDFDNIYEQLVTQLRLSKDDANAIVEKCAATIISKTSASNISALYKKMMLLTLYSKEDERYFYFFRYDKEFEGLERSHKKSKMLDDGLINCPTIFSCKPDKVADAFNYVASRITDKMVEDEFIRFRQAGNTTMTRYWCKYQIMRKWINNNFSLLTINAEKMRYRENIIKNLEKSLNERRYYGGRETNYNFDFLFHRPASISMMNSIPIDKINSNARENILLLERYVGEKGTVDYIEKNHYVLAMDNRKLSALLKMIDLHDHENPDEPYKERFFMLGKSLFGNKHCINFDIEPTFKRLAKIEDIQILDVEKMDDWTRLSKFVELFCGNDQNFFIHIQRLYHEKLQKDERGSRDLRKQIRTLLVKNGGWSEIIKDRKTSLSITTEVKSITDKRFAVEQLERTGDDYIDITSLQEKEDAFADDIKKSLARIRNAYAQGRDRLSKRFTDIDKLYEYTIEFLTERCFDDKEPISTLIEEELRSPLVETLKTLDGAYLDPQQSLFGAEKVIVPATENMYSPLKKLSKEISLDSSCKVDLDRIEIVKSKTDGEGK